MSKFTSIGTMTLSLMLFVADRMLLRALACAEAGKTGTPYCCTVNLIQGTAASSRRTIPGHACWRQVRFTSSLRIKYMALSCRFERSEGLRHTCLKLRQTDRQQKPGMRRIGVLTFGQKQGTKPASGILPGQCVITRLANLQLE